MKNFAKILERKSRNLLKQKFVETIGKANEEYTVGELQDKLKKLTHQCDTMVEVHEKFMRDNTEKAQTLK